MNIQSLLKNSHPIICEAFGREVSVEPSRVSQVKSALRQRGCKIVGTSIGNFGSTKIRFTPRGWSL